MALARDPADLGDLAARAGWRRVEPAGTVAAWTDDYSNVLGAMIRRKFDSEPACGSPASSLRSRPRTAYPARRRGA